MITISLTKDQWQRIALCLGTAHIEYCRNIRLAGDKEDDPEWRKRAESVADLADVIVDRAGLHPVFRIRKAKGGAR